ncbi:hypothetical protein, partial [Pseudomonas syringae]
ELEGVFNAVCLGLSHVVSLRLLRHLARDTFFRGKVSYQGATSIVLRQNLAMTPSQVIAHPDGVSRGVLYTTIQRGLQTLHLCSVHAWSPNGNDWDLIHNNLMSRVIAVAGANPVIVGGDFNQAANRSAVGQWAIPGGSHFGGGSLAPGVRIVVASPVFPKKA